MCKTLIFILLLVILLLNTKKVSGKILCPESTTFRFEACEEFKDTFNCGTHDHNAPSTDAKSMGVFVLDRNPVRFIKIVHCHKLELTTSCVTDWLWRSTIQSKHRLVEIKPEECKVTADLLPNYPKPSCEWNSEKIQYSSVIEGREGLGTIELATKRILFPGFNSPCDYGTRTCLSDDKKTMIRHESYEDFVHVVSHAVRVRYPGTVDMELESETYGTILVKNLKKVVIGGETYLHDKSGLTFKTNETFNVEFDKNHSIEDQEDSMIDMALKRLDRRTRVKACQLALRAFVDQKETSGLLDLRYLPFFAPMNAGLQDFVFANKTTVVQCHVRVQSVSNEECRMELEEIATDTKLNMSPLGIVKDGQLQNFEENLDQSESFISIKDLQLLVKESEIFNLHKKYGYKNHDEMKEGKTIKHSRKLFNFDYLETLERGWNQLKSMWNSTERWIIIIISIVIIICFLWILNSFLTLFNNLPLLHRSEFIEMKSRTRNYRDKMVPMEHTYESD